MDILLDRETNDVVVVGSDLALTSGQQGIEQHLKQRLQTFFGEWFLDNRIGVPYFQQILKKNINPSVVEDLIVSEIINTDGIVEIIDLETNLEKAIREFQIEFKARTIEGDVINFSEVII